LGTESVRRGVLCGPLTGEGNRQPKRDSRSQQQGYSSASWRFSGCHDNHFCAMGMSSVIEQSISG
jgi:hypothetical protein